MINKICRWIIFNVGCFELLESDLTRCERDWDSKFNSKWHGFDPSVILNEISNLQECNLIARDPDVDGYFRLSKSGIDEWIQIANPDFTRSYEWICSDPTSVDYDFRITIAASNWETALAVFARSLNDGFFSLVSYDNLTIDESCVFYPLYWCKLNGVKISFDAAHAEQSIAKVQRNFKLSKNRDFDWFQKIQDEAT